MAEHITDPRVVAGMMIISSDETHVTISGSEGLGELVWSLVFEVRDGKIVVTEDTGTHLSADLVLTAADLFP